MKHNSLYTVLLFLFSLFAQAQTSQPYSFRTVPFGGGGCVSGIITCPTQKNLIYARTDVGGAFRWVEATKSWKSLHFACPKLGAMCVMSIAVDPQYPNRVYCFAGEGYFYYSCIMKSVDYGETWTYIDVTNQFKASGNVAGKSTGERLIVDPNKDNVLYCGSPMHGLFKSTDYGETWTKITTLPNTNTSDNFGITFVNFIPESGKKGSETPCFYLGVARRGDNKAPIDSVNIFMTKDGGKTWLPISTLKGNGTTVPPTDIIPNQNIYAGGKIYFVYKGNGKGGIWRYDVAGEFWDNISPVTNMSLNGISVDNTTKPTVIAATTGHGGLWQGWKPGVVTWGDDIYRGFIDANAKVTWGAKRLLEGQTVNYDTNWFSQASGMHWTFDVEIDPFNKDRIFVVSGNGIFSSDNFTKTPSLWYHNVRNLEETITMEATSKPGGPFLLALGDVSGGTYTDPTKYGLKFSPAQSVTSGVDYATLSNVLIRTGSSRTAGGITSPIMYSKDNGATWTGVPADAIPYGLTKSDTLVKGAGYGRIAISADAKIIAWHVSWETKNITKKTHYGNFYTADYGKTWVEFPAAVIPGETVISSDKVNPNVFYVSTGPAIYTYTWNGTSFDYVSNTPPESISRMIRVNPLVEGEFLAFSGKSLYLFSEKGAKVTKSPDFTYVGSVAWGKNAPGRDNAVIFCYGTMGTDPTARVYRSDDYMKTWVKVTNDNSRFGGGLNKNLLVGDMNKYGRVFISNVGIGLIYADIDSSVYARRVTVFGGGGKNVVYSKGGKLQMSALFTPSNTTNKKLAWEIDNTQFATIDSTGMVTGIKAGDVKVTATALDGTAIFGMMTVKVVDEISGINDITPELTLARVYPNPFKNTTNVYTEKELEYRIYSLSGTLLESGVVSGNGEVGLNLGSGIYLLRLTDKQSGLKNQFKLVKN